MSGEDKELSTRDQLIVIKDNIELKQEISDLKNDLTNIMNISSRLLTQETNMMKAKASISNLRRIMHESGMCRVIHFGDEGFDLNHILSVLRKAYKEAGCE